MYQDDMRKNLAALCKGRETPQHPFRGTISWNRYTPSPKEYAAYFAIAGNNLLVATYGRATRKSGWAMRIPLDIKRIKIKKSLVFKTYQVTMSLNGDQDFPQYRFRAQLFTKCHIRAQARGQQKDHVLAFITYMRKRQKEVQP